MTFQLIEYQKNIIKQCFDTPSIFFECMEKIANDEIFSDEILRCYWQIFKLIYKEGETICMSIVQDVLKESSREDLIDDFKNVVEGKYTDEDQWSYQVFYLCEHYNKKKLLQMSKWVASNIGKLSSDDLLIGINEKTKGMDTSGVKTVKFSTGFQEAFSDIWSIHKGEKRSSLITGNPKFDRIIGITESRILFIAAQKKIGKTRFLVDLMDRLINNNANIAVLWFTLEMQVIEMLRTFIGRLCMLTDDELLEKGDYKLSLEDITRIRKAEKVFQDYPVDFVEEAVNIYNIVAKFESFKKRNQNKHCILVVDNIGLITPHIKDPIANDDDMSRIFKNLRDSTKGTIILLHHLKKSSEARNNRSNGYEPIIEDVRGTSRLMDYANQVILLHRYDHYNDLMEAAQKENRLEELKGLFIVNCAINRSSQNGKMLFRHDIAHSRFEEITTTIKTQYQQD